MIPQEEHPEINFVGLLIGPRGNTLKSKLSHLYPDLSNKFNLCTVYCLKGLCFNYVEFIEVNINI